MIKEVLQQLEPLDAQIDALSGADDGEMLDLTAHAAELAELAAQELGAQYPEFADQISENLAAFCEKLSSLQDYGEQALSDLSCRQAQDHQTDSHSNQTCIFRSP